MKKKNISTIISVIFAIVSYISLIYTGNIKSYDFISLIIFCFICIIFFKYFKLSRKNKDLILISLFLSFLLVFGSLCLELIDSRNVSFFNQLLTTN